jgi:hypothetical protein
LDLEYAVQPHYKFKVSELSVLSAHSQVSMLFLPFYLALFAVSAVAKAAKTRGTAYNFAIPSSNRTVNVKMISAGTALGGTSPFFASDPDLPHSNSTPAAAYAFLLEHPHSGRRILFDLGLRKDLDNLSPFIQKAFSGPDGKLPFFVDKDVPDQLVDGNVTLESIDTVIWRSVLLLVFAP